MPSQQTTQSAAANAPNPDKKTASMPNVDSMSNSELIAFLEKKRVEEKALGLACKWCGNLKNESSNFICGHDQLYPPMGCFWCNSIAGRGHWCRR